MNIMSNFDNFIRENIQEHSPQWPQTPDHTYGILIVDGFGLGKTNALLNLINRQPGIDTIFFYAKDPYKSKHHLLRIKARKSWCKHLKDQKPLIQYSNDIKHTIKELKIAI